MRKQTVYEVLRQKLGREPSHVEMTEDVKRILREAVQEAAAKGKLSFQRR